MKEVKINSYNGLMSTGSANYFTSESSLRQHYDTSVKLVPSFDISEASDSGKYTVFDIANWFLSKQPLTHLQLQKLCYYAQAWCYAIKEYRLMNTDFQAWVHGPVSPVLYDKLKCFGFDTIKIKGNYRCNIDQEDVSLLDDVWETYGDRTGGALEVLTHKELPWIEARRGYASNERCNVVISPESMKAYYKSIYIGK